jgi:ubiquinone/menaquinone biosynthesis C-methylase UbiE
MNADPYKDFAERYDLSFGQFGDDDPQTVEFFRTLFKDSKVHSVLDCACGTGRHLPLFHSLGCVVFGSDISQAMLARGRKNLAEHGLDIPLVQADFRELPRHFERRFDAVVCLAALGFMPDEEECAKALASMFAVLRDGGLLILTAMPTDRQWKEQPRFQLVANNRDFTRLFVIDYKDCTARYNVLDIFHSPDKYDLQEWSAELYVFLRDEQEMLLKAAGFRKVDFYASFDFKPYDKETSNGLIAVAQK